jgi:hypothetical protein
MTNKRKNKKLVKMWLNENEIFELERYLKDRIVPIELIRNIYERGDIVI